MRTGGWVVLLALVAGFIGGWILRSPRTEGDPASTPGLVDSSLQAQKDSLVARFDSTIATIGDSTKKYKDRADSLRQVLIARRAQRGRAQPSRPRTSATDTTIHDTAPLPGNPVDTLIPTIIDTTSPDTAILVGPQTYEQCMEDLNTVDEESTNLRRALTECQEDTDLLKTDLAEIHGNYLAQFAWRQDTFPKIVQQIRNEPRPCKENWVLFKVDCGTAGWIKFGTGGVLGFIIAK